MKKYIYFDSEYEEAMVRADLGSTKGFVKFYGSDEEIPSDTKTSRRMMDIEVENHEISQAEYEKGKPKKH